MFIIVVFYIRVLSLFSKTKKSKDVGVWTKSLVNCDITCTYRVFFSLFSRRRRVWMDVLCEEINYTDDAKKVLKTYSPCTQHKKATPTEERIKQMYAPVCLSSFEDQQERKKRNREC